MSGKIFAESAEILHVRVVAIDSPGYGFSDFQLKWYGLEDQNVSLNMGKYYASHIPGSVLTIFPREGHLVPVTHASEILKTLTR